MLNEIDTKVKLLDAGEVLVLSEDESQPVALGRAACFDAERIRDKSTLAYSIKKPGGTICYMPKVEKKHNYIHSSCGLFSMTQPGERGLRRGFRAVLMTEVWFREPSWVISRFFKARDATSTLNDNDIYTDPGEGYGKLTRRFLETLLCPSSTLLCPSSI